jgi:hypothetical protein
MDEKCFVDVVVVDIVAILWMLLLLLILLTLLKLSCNVVVMYEILNG